MKQKLCHIKIFVYLREEEFLQRYKKKDLVQKINEALANQSNREDTQWLKAAKQKHRQIVDDQR